MPDSCANQLTTVEMLDVLEARIRDLRTADVPGAGEPPPPAVCAMLKAHVESTGLSCGEYAALLGVSREELDEWLRGLKQAPAWALAAARLILQLTPSARRKLLKPNHSRAAQQSNRSHPFSRIEEL